MGGCLRCADRGSLCEAELGRGGGTVPCFVSALGVSCALTLELTRAANELSRSLKLHNHGESPCG